MILATVALAGVFLTAPDPQLLAAWRTPDSKGAACASCHSPDGIELSAFGFDREDLLRRASRHLDADRQKLVLELILSGRAKLGPTADPMKVRPMQPGGSVLPGASAPERDAVFVAQLERLVPLLSGDRVRSLSDARKVAAQVLAVDLKSLPVGIEMNRLSEDGFHGEEHASLASWIPDVPMPTTPEVVAAQQRYLDAPSESSLRDLDALVCKEFKPTSAIQTLALAKYRSLLVLQHRLRTPTVTGNDMPDGNPFWQIAEVGRQYGESGASQLALPGDVAQAKTAGPKIGDQMKALRLPWYWLGWIADPSLQRSGSLKETKRADYFSMTLMHDGPYPGHAAFMLLRKLLQQAEGRPFEIQFSFFVLERPLIEREPSDLAARAKFRRLAGNAFRTCLWLLADDLERRKQTIFPESQALQIRTLETYLKAIGEPEEKLTERTLKLLAQAKVLGRG